MTQTTSDAPVPEAEGVGDAVRYHVSEEWFTERGLVYQAVIRERVCSACRDRFGQAVEDRIPIFDKKTGRMHMETQASTFGTDPVKVIKEHCSQSPNYITRDMPTLEAIFRAMLAHGNTPMTLEETRQVLSEWCPGGGCQWLLLPVETLERLLAHDTSYGLLPIA